jgi:heme exporter protein A
MGVEPLLSVRDVACVRGGRWLFEGVSFTLSAGEALVLTGPNGVGKTSLMRLLAGLSEPAEGTITRPERLAWLGHDNALKRELGLRANLELWQAVQGATGDLGAALDALGLADLADLPVRLLSQGQKRRAALVRVAASGAALWLLDEPTVGLDTASVAAVAGLIARHRAAGGAVVATTHIDLGLAGARSLALAPPPAEAA